MKGCRDRTLQREQRWTFGVNVLRQFSPPVVPCGGGHEAGPPTRLCDPHTCFTMRSRATWGCGETSKETASTKRGHVRGVTHFDDEETEAEPLSPEEGGACIGSQAG